MHMLPNGCADRLVHRKGSKVLVGNKSVLLDLLFLSACVPALFACTPTVRVEAPREPITINLNVRLDADVRVRLEEQAREDIRENPGIF